jgi:hypothetical protein
MIDLAEGGVQSLDEDVDMLTADDEWRSQLENILLAS